MFVRGVYVLGSGGCGKWGANRVEYVIDMGVQIGVRRGLEYCCTILLLPNLLEVGNFKKHYPVSATYHNIVAINFGEKVPEGRVSPG